MSQESESLVYPPVLGFRSRAIPIVVDLDVKVPHQLVNGRELLNTVKLIIREPFLDKVISDVIQIIPVWSGASSAAAKVIAES